MAGVQQVNEVDEVVKKILAQERVSKYLVFNNEGIVIRSGGWPNTTGDNGHQQCVQVAASVSRLVTHCARGCQDLLVPPNNEPECLRLKTKKHEMIVAPNKQFTLVAIQDEESIAQSDPTDQKDGRNQ